MEEALTFCRIDAEPVDLGDQQRANELDLKRQIIAYLRYLQAGGHHVLFFPPEFDEDDLRRSIHFSLTAGTELTPREAISGITAVMINNYLSLLWFTCAFIARSKRELRSHKWNDRTLLASVCSWHTASYRSEWHCSVRFGQPRVDILCAREVILYFKLTEVSFFAKDDEKQEKECVSYAPYRFL